MTKRWQSLLILLPAGLAWGLRLPRQLLHQPDKPGAD